MSVTDFLGKAVGVPITLTAGALQLGGGADPLGATGSIAQDASGNLYVMGSTVATMPGQQLGTVGNESLYLARIDPSGNVNWISQLWAGVFSTTIATQMVCTSVGTCYILGYTDGSLPASMTGSRGVQDGFLAAFSSSGALLWARQFGGGPNSTTTPLNLLQDSNGNLIVTGTVAGGTFSGAVFSQYGTHGATDVLVAQFSPSGAPNWIRQIGAGTTTNTTISVSLLNQASSVTYVFGQVDGGGTLCACQSGTHGTVDLFLSRIDSTGSVTANQWGGGASSNSQAVTMAQDATGRLDVLGSTTGTVVPAAPGAVIGANGAGHLVIAQWASTGAFNWADRIGGGGTSTLTPIGIVTDSGSNIIVVGRTSLTDLTTMASPATQIGTHGASDAVVVKIPPGGGAQTWWDQIGAGGLAVPSPLLLRTHAGDNILLVGTLNGTFSGVVAPAPTVVGTQAYIEGFLMELTSAGAYSWATEVAGSGVSITAVSGILFDSSNNIFAIGFTSGLLSGGQYGAHGNNDSFWLKLTPTGGLSWVGQLGAGGSSATISIQHLLSSGSTLVLAQATRKLIGTLVGPDYYSATLLKIDSSGLLQ